MRRCLLAVGLAVSACSGSSAGDLAAVRYAGGSAGAASESGGAGVAPSSGGSETGSGGEGEAGAGAAGGSGSGAQGGAAGSAGVASGSANQGGAAGGSGTSGASGAGDGGDSGGCDPSECNGDSRCVGGSCVLLPECDCAENGFDCGRLPECPVVKLCGPNAGACNDGELCAEPNNNMGTRICVLINYLNSTCTTTNPPNPSGPCGTMCENAPPGCNVPYGTCGMMYSLETGEACGGCDPAGADRWHCGPG